MTIALARQFFMETYEYTALQDIGKLVGRIVPQRVTRAGGRFFLQSFVCSGIVGGA